MTKEKVLDRLYEREGNKITCQVCQRGCSLAEGQSGYCSGYANESGEFVDLTYGRITTAQVTELGWAPVKMFGKPDTKILSVGSRGCNFYCRDCVNREHSGARHDREVLSQQIVEPEVLIDYAKALGCEGIAANFNEALLAAVYWHDIFELAKKERLFTVAVTNGYSSRQALDLICPILDVYRCDIKAISSKAMGAQAIGVSPKGVFKSLKYIRKKYPKVHIEAVTMVVPSVNDSVDELEGIAGWVGGNLGAETPWHISPFESMEQRSLNGAPPYLTKEDLLDGNRVKASSIFFGSRGEVGLRAGDMDLDLCLPQEHPELELAALVGREAGLENVFIKTDGH